MLRTPRRLSHVVLAGAVIALVAIVVAAAALPELRGQEQRLGSRPRPPATSKPALVPVADSAGVPTSAGMTAALAAVAPTRTWASSAAGSPTPRPAPRSGSSGPTSRCSPRRSTRC